MLRDPDADWRLGVRATGLDPVGRQVLLADGESLPYDRLLIATGTRARPWPQREQAALDGVFTLRTRDDAGCLAERHRELLLDQVPGVDQIVGVFGRDEITTAVDRAGSQATEQRTCARTAFCEIFAACGSGIARSTFTFSLRTSSAV